MKVVAKHKDLTPSIFATCEDNVTLPLEKGSDCKIRKTMKQYHLLCPSEPKEKFIRIPRGVVAHSAGVTETELIGMPPVHGFKEVTLQVPCGNAFRKIALLIHRGLEWSINNGGAKFPNDDLCNGTLEKDGSLNLDCPDDTTSAAIVLHGKGFSSKTIRCNSAVQRPHGSFSWKPLQVKDVKNLGDLSIPQTAEGIIKVELPVPALEVQCEQISPTSPTRQLGAAGICFPFAIRTRKSGADESATPAASSCMTQFD